MKGLRISIEKATHHIYEILTKRGVEHPDQFPFESMKDLFMTAACLGAKNDSYEEIETNEIIFGSDVFDEEVDIPIMFSLAYQRNKDLNDVIDSKKTLKIVQEYANAGIRIINNELVDSSGKPLDNLVALILDHT